MSFLTRNESISQAKLLGPRFSSSSAGAGGIALSASCGNYTTTSTSFVNVTNLSVALTTTGRPVQLMIVPDGTTNAAAFGNGGAIAQIQIVNASTATTVGLWSSNLASGNYAATLGCLDLSVNTGTAGNSTYVVQLKISANTAVLFNYKLLAFEI